MPITRTIPVIHAVKDIDGAREIRFQVTDGSFFLWGRGFSYEFDLGIVRHQMRKLLAATTEDPADMAGPFA